MRTRTSALVIAILLILGISVAALAQTQGDPPRDDVSTLDTTIERDTPTAPVRAREHQPFHHPEVMNDQVRDRAGDHMATCTPDQDREWAPDQDREATPRPDRAWDGHAAKGERHEHHTTN